ncbi:MAG: pilin [Patescibacteria group bacterium]
MNKFLLLIPILLFSFLAQSVSAQGFDLIVCDGVTEECTFDHLIELAQNVITALVLLSTFVAVLAFIYSGFLLMTSGGSESRKTQAKGIFTKVLIGYLWILAAWLLVYTITSLTTGTSLLGPPQ